MHACAMGYRRERAGSLVEVIMSLVILTAGVLGGLAFFYHSRSSLNLESRRRTAAEIAHARLEELRTVAFDDISLYAEDDFEVEVEGITGYRDTVTEDIDENSDSTVDYNRKVTVTVSWPGNNLNQEVELVTFRSAHR